MANTRIGQAMRGTWAVKTLALVVALYSATIVTAQQPEDASGRPPNVRNLMKLAQEEYKRGDYEKAATLFNQVEKYKTTTNLSDVDRKDLKKFVQLNSTALTAQHEGTVQIHQAEEFLTQGKNKEAANLLKNLKNNQFLAAGDHQTLERLNEYLRQGGVASGKSFETKVPNDEKSWMEAGRHAFKQGDLDTAEICGKEAKKVQAFMHLPLADTPAKLLADVEKARRSANPPPPVADAKKSSGMFKLVNSINIFSKSPKDEKKDDGTPPAKGSDSVPPPLGKDAPPPLVPLPNTKGPDIRQNQYPDSEVPPGAGDANKVMARALIKEAYAALEKNDLETARRKAVQARDLHVELDWWEVNPTRLLEDIQQRGNSGNPAPSNTMKAGPTADARILVKDARSLLKQGRIDEAEDLCNQAAAGGKTKSWGLFEDSPEKLRADIQKMKGRRGQDEANRLMVDARKLFAMGRVQEAKQKAMNAQTLHGPYTIWDLGDRPQKLLEEIARFESKTPVPESAKGTSDIPSLPPYAPNVETVVKVAPPAPLPPPLVAGAAQASNKVRATALIQEARALQKKGLLIEARIKAIDAEQLRVTYGPDDDTPGNVLLSLAAQCERRVDQLIKQSTEDVQNHPTDAGRFQRADAAMKEAHTIAQSFRLDTVRIDQKYDWLKQTALAAGAPQPADIAQAPNSGITQTGGIVLPPLPGEAGQKLPASVLDAPNNRNRALGLEKLDKARLELQNGQLALARRLVEEAFNPMYGVQEEAAIVMNTIDADDYNHRVNMANRNADAGIEAFYRGDLRQAATILQGVEVKLVQPDKARRLGEILSSPQMQPVQQVDAKQPVPSPGNPAGKATATDLQPGDELTAQVRAIEEIQFQQMRERNMNVRSTALELFKAGKKDQAVDMLKEYLDELTSANFDPQRLALLKRPVEKRWQEFRTMIAQEAIEKQVQGSGTIWNEEKHQQNITKTQQEVAEFINQYRALVKEGKFKEAKAAALKAKELDPDNQAAQMALVTINTLIAQDNYNRGVARSEKVVLDELNPDVGPHATMSDPVVFDAAGLARMNSRKEGAKGYPLPTNDPRVRYIEQKLNEQISNISFRDTPLRDALDVLKEQSQINIVPDYKALQDASISLDTPLTLHVEKITLRSALNILLNQVRLTYVAENQVLSITTPEKKRGGTKIVTYPVADLVIPVENHPTPAIADLNTQLARHQASTSGMITSASPYTPPQSLNYGQTVSSQGSGMGTAFARDGQAAGGGGYNLVQSRNSGDTLEQVLISLIQNTVASDSWKDVGGQGTIQYFPMGMALVVNQTQEVQEQVGDLLQSLRRLQDLEVAIEMKLVSVSESFFERIGVDFNVNIKSPTSSANQAALLAGQFTPTGQPNNTFQGVKAITGLTPAGTLTPDLGIPIKTGSFDFAVPPFGGYPGTLGADGGLSLGLAFLSNIQVFMLLEAAQGDRRLNVMQAPKITVFNGQTANIDVQDFQFFLTGININQANAQTFFTPNNQPFPLGVTMQVTPVVSADRRFVRLNLTPSLTNLASTSVPLIPVQIPVPTILNGPGAGGTVFGQPQIFTMFFQQPTFTQISVNTTVNVPDGGTVLLGGLKTMSEGRVESGPPILSKIPYLNRLFTNTAFGRDGQSLMIMVTPRIIINEEEELQYRGEIPQIPRQ